MSGNEEMVKLIVAQELMSLVQKLYNHPMK